MSTDLRAVNAALVAGSAVLDQGRRLNALSRSVTWVALLTGTVGALLGGGPALSFASLAVVAVIAGLVELWFAARVDLDAQLFRHLGEEARAGRLDLASFDAGMHLAGLMRAPTATRGVAERLAGARRLLGWQAVACMAQLLLMIAAGALAWVRP